MKNENVLHVEFFLSFSGFLYKAKVLNIADLVYTLCGRVDQNSLDGVWELGIPEL